MPCYSPPTDGYDAETSATATSAERKAKANSDRLQHLEEKLDEMQNEMVPKKYLDEVTRMLCGLCTRLEDVGRSANIDRVDGLRDWWETHKEWDERRRST